MPISMKYGSEVSQHKPKICINKVMFVHVCRLPEECQQPVTSKRDHSLNDAL